MRGAASVAVARSDRADLAPLQPGDPHDCFVCGGEADGRVPTTSKGIPQCGWSESFTAWSHLASPPVAGAAVMCSPCRTVVLDEVNLREAPWGKAPGRLLVNHEARYLNSGLAGLDDLIEVSDPARREPFSLIAGSWMHSIYYWFDAPVAYPSHVWPAFFYETKASRPGIVWLRRSHLLEVREAVEGLELTRNALKANPRAASLLALDREADRDSRSVDIDRSAALILHILTHTRTKG